MSDGRNDPAIIVLIAITASFAAILLGAAISRSPGGHTDAQVIAAAEARGFTHEQARFLKFGPHGSVEDCAVVGFSEKACDFFRAADQSNSTDADFLSKCTGAGLREDQCKMLRFGIDS